MSKRIPVPGYTPPNKRYLYSKIRGKDSFKLWKAGQLKLQHDLCFYCHRLIELKGANTEHVIPLSKGGSNKKSNLVVSCGNCNKNKGSHLYSKEEIDQMYRAFAAVASNIKIKSKKQPELYDSEDEIIEFINTFA
jgi:5-methylcytosine-specific restriction endonuclease McrA